MGPAGVIAWLSELSSNTIKYEPEVANCAMALLVVCPHHRVNMCVSVQDSHCRVVGSGCVWVSRGIQDQKMAVSWPTGFVFPAMLTRWTEPRQRSTLSCCLFPRFRSLWIKVSWLKLNVSGEASERFILPFLNMTLWKPLLLSGVSYYDNTDLCLHWFSTKPVHFLFWDFSILTLKIPCVTAKCIKCRILRMHPPKNCIK